MKDCGHDFAISARDRAYCPTCRAEVARRNQAAMQAGRVRRGTVFARVRALLEHEGQVRVAHLVELTGWSRTTARGKLSTWRAQGRIRRVRRGVYALAQGAGRAA